MTLIYLVELSQVIGSTALVASLVFVGIQLHQSVRATRAASHHAVSEALNQINLLWAQDSEVTRIWLRGTENRAALSDDERWRFDATLRAYIHVCETMYVQSLMGAGDSGIVAAEEDGIKAVFSSTSVKTWWAENPFGFCRRFREHVERLTRP